MTQILLMLDVHRDALIARYGEAPSGQPAFVAMREGRPVGMMGTKPRVDLVECGPLAADSAFIARDLIDAYERFLSGSGVLQYHFAIRRLDRRWMRMIERAPGVEKIGATERALFYRKTIARVSSWAEAM